MGSSIFQMSTEHLYGTLLPNCEFLLDGPRHYVCYHRTEQIIVACWNDETDSWSSGIDRRDLDGLSFSSPRLFEETVFSSEDPEKLQKKANLNECLVHGISVGSEKKVVAQISPDQALEINFDSKKWNEALLGNSMSFLEVVHDEYSKAGTAEPYEYEIYIAKHWVTIHLEDPDDSWFDFDIFEGNLKDLKGYYT